MYNELKKWRQTGSKKKLNSFKAKDIIFEASRGWATTSTKMCRGEDKCIYLLSPDASNDASYQ